MASKGYVRKASHAGSWYDASGEVLQGQLDGWLRQQPQMVIDHTEGVRAIIVPHAGYRFSGSTAGFAYQYIHGRRGIKRVFILGPSHHVGLRKCSISGASAVETPLGELPVDDVTRDVLLATGLFDVTSQRIDEEEHSIEMHLPFVAVTMRTGSPDCMVVPIMVGSITSSRGALQYAHVLQPYFDDPENLFVISSDFCHWGSRFGYQPFDAKKSASISDYISWLDHEAMALIESQDLDGFLQYLTSQGNTICGRNPILVLLGLLRGTAMADQRACRAKFIRYAQSSAARSMEDSSVSYAACVVSASLAAHSSSSGGGSSSSSVNGAI